MTTYVSETPSGKEISAYVILKNGKHIATVRVRRTNLTCLVNIFNFGDINNSSKSYGFQSAKASGGGYDKFAAALDGMFIDGNELTDHPGGGIDQVEKFGLQVIQAI